MPVEYDVGSQSQEQLVTKGQHEQHKPAQDTKRAQSPRVERQQGDALHGGDVFR